MKDPIINEQRAPAVNDPRWKEWSQPLFEFLRGPRDWRHLERWGKNHQFNQAKLRHCLAWLEENGLARTIYRDGGYLWVNNLYRGVDMPHVDYVPDAAQAEGE